MGSKYVLAFSRKIESMEELHCCEQDEEVIDCMISSTTIEIVLHDESFYFESPDRLNIFWQFLELVYKNNSIDSEFFRLYANWN